ncbi:growth arrest and DNA damage-inducible protein GADD45 beta-like isoform X2 [Crassostrea virginica]|uniref:Growth arrest and DNA damage-inducible protein GADD45 alpha-like isoform X2 n=1 Tax=Crassostrea virginica TaxID=6565 RepID=A0A8B8CRW2_CRAVI|nr:growth arrest and DNA damage-inducible protein GADD45 alpha-like isoform X2 [Crassostrea virginica]
MTFSEDDRMDINKTFREVMVHAADKGRVTMGLYTCARVLQMAPEGVMLCVMPVETGNDDLVHMQHVLIEAHCREHKITNVKVDCTMKLEQLLLVPASTRRNPKDNDLSCVIVQVAKEGKTQLEKKFLTRFHKHPQDLIIQIPA